MNIRIGKYRMNETLESLESNGIYRVGDIPGIGRMFPDLPNDTKDNVKITHEGVYSITDPKIMAILNREIAHCRALMPPANDGWIGTSKADLSQLTITDATANCGGSVLGFATAFKHVNAVEIDKETFTVLSHNIKIYGHENITLINADYTEIIEKLEQDVIFVDPPWGGHGYDLKVGLRLTLGDISLLEVVKRGLKVAKLVVLKLPLNYDFSEFVEIKHYQKRVGRIMFVFCMVASAGK
ncbi:methyltransferase [Faustovirus]|nr:methyltransferase [Faustovirus]